MRLTALDCSHVIEKNCSEECSCEISTTASNLILTTDETITAARTTIASDETITAARTTITSDATITAARSNVSDSTARRSTEENRNSDFNYIPIAVTVPLVAILFLASFFICMHKKNRSGKFVLNGDITKKGSLDLFNTVAQKT